MAMEEREDRHGHVRDIVSLYGDDGTGEARD